MARCKALSDEEDHARHQKYHSSKAYKDSHPPTQIGSCETLCTACDEVLLDNCCWMNDDLRLPVEGWVAIERKRKTGWEEPTVGYYVISCPNFKKEIKKCVVSVKQVPVVEVAPTKKSKKYFPAQSVGKSQTRKSI